MSRPKVWRLWMVSMAVGAGGCGGMGSEAPAPLAPGDVEQQAPSIGCEVDSQGYQTGRCLYVTSCSEYSSACQVGVRTNPVFYPACGTWVNTNRCGVLGMEAPHSAPSGR
ncbi:hypothetical protein [Stigmatella erecta]|uniref:Lipoprotein n=1 Tax=Stigmatella erecta TaxID=83460 RepID=A0A1I0IWD6_9BACT|nr:hypothetical protein [Stigmatella erecta]SEU01694.1 hypothetical protein SAMN05443639_106337 [Stigmatella erecta]